MNDMKLNKTILDTILKLLLNFDNGDIEFNKSNLSKIAGKKVKDDIWLFDNTVDLDLPSRTLWTKYNIGATCGSTPESWYGNYYAWGELEPKTEYTEENYTYKDNPKTLPLENDVAFQYNKYLRMPSKEQIEELVNYTTSEWVENYNRIDGLNGRVFTSKTNSNSFFISAAGGFVGNNLYNAGNACYLWSRSLHFNTDFAYDLRFDSDDVDPSYHNRLYCGLSVRGVAI